MIKGYSGVFRLGEATSTWDADSPVRLLVFILIYIKYSFAKKLMLIEYVQLILIKL